ncbi:MAG: hypothetical protein ACRDZ8_16160 [Acidimicrobiales bacterium]
MIRLDAATVLLQWSVGGLFFLWVTTRRRIAGIGYGWLLRSVYLVMALGAVAAGVVIHPDGWREAVSAAVAVAAAVALVSSIARRRAGVSGERAVQERRTERVAAMTGIDRDTKVVDHSRTEFDPRMDLVAPAIGVIGLVLAAVADGGPHGLAIVRTLVGAALFGAVTDAMLLGHWYLVQPGLGRGLLNELVRLLAWIWPFEVAAMLWPTGMIQVLDGTIKDGYGGLLGWFWVACAAATIILCVVTRAALKERYYSAVMAATGFLYLAILTGFGTDLVARALVARGGI